ncbi:MAG: glutamate racemase [Tissierella sp.]|uniref:glutamate racemase n=1 Tax=Tissierella sp. TaxID=41274 RepID=UPI003F9A9B51
MADNRKIGIIDSGVGGLTTAKEFRVLLSNESIIYLGDNANVPYGNRSKEEIYRLTKKLVDFLIRKDVKLIAVACNTISSILDEYFLDLKIPIVSIIKPVIEHVDKIGLKKIGVIATEFTINSGIYEKYLLKIDKDMSIATEGCPSLAEKIDGANYTDEEILKEVSIHMDSILKKGNVKDIILGCTHYPIVLDKFKEVAPHINFINPAYEQTIFIKNLMKKQLTNSNTTHSTFELFTTGKKETHLKILDNLSMEKPDEISEVEKF